MVSGYSFTSEASSNTYTFSESDTVNVGESETDWDEDYFVVADEYFSSDKDSPGLTFLSGLTSDIDVEYDAEGEIDESGSVFSSNLDLGFAAGLVITDAATGITVDTAGVQPESLTNVASGEGSFEVTETFADEVGDSLQIYNEESYEIAVGPVLYINFRGNGTSNDSFSSSFEVDVTLENEALESSLVGRSV